MGNTERGRGGKGKGREREEQEGGRERERGRGIDSPRKNPKHRHGEINVHIDTHKKRHQN